MNANEAWENLKKKFTSVIENQQVLITTITRAEYEAIAPVDKTKIFNELFVEFCTKVWEIWPDLDIKTEDLGCGDLFIRINSKAVYDSDEYCGLVLAFEMEKFWKNGLHPYFSYEE